MNVSFDDSDLRKLSARFDQANARVVSRVRMALVKTAYDIQGDARMFAPVDTGNLRNSINVGPVKNRGRGNMHVEIGPSAEYGAYVEFGTSRMAPRAYMGPALDRNSPGFLSAMEEIARDPL